MNSIAAIVQACACEIDDVKMLEKIQYKLDNKCVLKYHIACVNNYKYACSRQLEKQETNVSKQRQCNKIAYESVCSFVKNVVISRKECTNLSRLYEVSIVLLKNQFYYLYYLIWFWKNDSDVQSNQTVINISFNFSPQYQQHSVDEPPNKVIILEDILLPCTSNVFDQNLSFVQTQIFNLDETAWKMCSRKGY